MVKIKFPLIKPYLTQKEENEVIKVLRSGWLTQGRYVKALEEQIKKYNRVKYAFLLNSATSGLILAIKALSLKEKDEVICPSFTFPATSNAVILAGVTPVFCDIDLDTFNISPEKIESAITNRTKVIMPVHEFGLSAAMKEILAIAKKYNLYVIEDAACSLGAEYNNRKTGTLGDTGVFSFHPRKVITSGEGGCIVTNSTSIANKIQSLRNHGEIDKRFIDCGFNFRLSDIQAAILYSQFQRIEQIIQKRIQRALNYNRLFKPLEDREILRRPSCAQGFRHIYQSYVIFLSKKVNRDKVKGLLRQKGIETQFGTYCVPLLDYYRKNFRTPQHSYKNASYAYKKTLTLPLYHTLKSQEQEFIVRELEKAIEKCAQ